MYQGSNDERGEQRSMTTKCKVPVQRWLNHAAGQSKSHISAVSGFVSHILQHRSLNQSGQTAEQRRLEAELDGTSLTGGFQAKWIGCRMDKGENEKKRRSERA